jgi:hypothetical protein
MFNPWFALAVQAAWLGWEAQSVIALRLMRLAGGGARGLNEARLMVADKMSAATEANVAAASAILAGDGHRTAKKVLRVYKKRVRANRSRLSRR